MDWTNIIIAALSFLGTFIGTYSGIKLMTYRIEQLERKVEHFSNINERVAIVERDLSTAHKRIDNIERKVESL